MKQPPLRVAVVGLGGFAGAHHTALAELEEVGMVKVVATCDPAVRNLADRRQRYRIDERGVEVFESFESLLEKFGAQLDLINVASPISCHASHHRACVERGIACYLEKPPTLDPEELESMITVESLATISTQVGFNHISQPWRLKLKRRIVAGEFGPVTTVGFAGYWQRDLAYFTRNAWAGKLMVGDNILLDSCTGNAMAHHLHNLLFHAGTPELMSWADPLEVTAELYRANPIQGPDTIFASGVLSGGIRFRLFATHACNSVYDHQETITCEDAVIEIPAEGPGRITWKNGVIEIFTAEPTTLRENIRGYLDYIGGAKPRPSTTLRDCRAFVHLNALLYLAGKGITPLPNAHLEKIDKGYTHAWVTPKLECIGKKFMADSIFPSQDNVDWGRAGGSSQQSDIPQLRSALEKMLP